MILECTQIYIKNSDEKDRHWLERVHEKERIIVDEQSTISKLQEAHQQPLNTNKEAQMKIDTLMDAAQLSSRSSHWWNEVP